MTEPSHAVFLSYASQDAEPAQKICEALRAAGIQVFLDQSELRGGDAWDQKIRREIHDCALFIPVISAHTASRHEGYFRLEWDLADQRTHMIARSRAFVVPVCLDATTEVAADVPESFQRVQWTRLPGGDTPPAFAERIRRLLSPELSPMSAGSGATPAIREPVRRSRRSKLALLAIVAVVLVAALAYFPANKFWIPKHATPETAARAGAAPTAFNPPPHSIAVLPFVNLSGDKEQDYFSDGLTEELLNSLAQIKDLQVAARTSAFSFKGKETDIGTIARKLNVAAVLEGSARRSAHTVRVTTQLVSGVTGFHLWSDTYDRDLGDMLRVQTEIATAVATALKVTLLGDEAAKIELGGTHNPAALEAYLRASKHFHANAKDNQTAIAGYSEAIRRDPNYALAYARRSLALNYDATSSATGSAIGDAFDKSQSDARRAITLAPKLAEGHWALAAYFERGSADFTRAMEEYQHAVGLAPGSADILEDYGTFAVWMGRTDTGLAAVRRAALLDPLTSISHNALGNALYFSRHYEESIIAQQDALTFNPSHEQARGVIGLGYYGLGNLQSARISCEAQPDQWLSQQCLAVTYDRLGKHADAEAMLVKLRASWGDDAAFQYAEVYAQWGDATKALEWLETALRLRGQGLETVKTDPLLDPLRNEPRFQAVERALKFPD
jgi:TolB-like protein